MAKDDRYRKQAADAQRMADRDVSASDKEAWLRIAQGWLSMIRKPKQTLADDFREAAGKGTGQGGSRSSH
jgi:hypothetical protein